MKRSLLPIAALVLLIALTATAAAHSHSPPPTPQSGHSHWSHSSYSHSNWIHSDHHPVSFSWGEHRSHFSNRYGHLTVLDGHEWRHRFPGLTAYRWHSQGQHDSFMYQGHSITHGILFFGSSDRLAGIGFMHNGSFVFVRDDHRSFRNHDAFFTSWFDR